MKVLLSFAMCALTCLSLRGTAAACGNSDPPEFQIEADPQDTTPPPPPRVELERVKRGKEPTRRGCSFESTSCDGTAWLVLHLEGGEAGAEPEQVGYVLEVKGQSPDLSRYLERPITPMFDPGMLQLSWEDGEGQERYEFELYVWSVDRAGNMSEEPTKVHVESGDARGCAALAATSTAHWSWMAALALLLLTRRARRRRCGS